MAEGPRSMTRAEAEAFARDACLAVGASRAQADALARATVAAEAIGRRAVGFAHLPDYLDGFRLGRIARDAEPWPESRLPALIACDAQGGLAQYGFDLAFDLLCDSAETYGVAVLALRNGFTAGELGYYPRRLAERGFVALAAANGPALMTTVGAGAKPVYCTNPFAFASPVTDGPPLLIDQSSSATAFVEMRRRAQAGETLPEGWAVDSEGNPTTNAREGLQGALLAFGGSRGANIALMVETLAAGVAGANWSLDAPPFDSGAQTPGAGLVVVAIRVDAFQPEFPSRLAAQLERLAALGVHVPGRGRMAEEEIEIDAQTLAKIAAITAAPAP